MYLGIAGLRAITRELEMPLLPDSEIDSAVRLQALDVIPFAIDKALISARPLEETVGANGMPERRVLVAAAHRDLVDPLVEIATAAGLTPVSVEPTSSAMIRALFDPANGIDGPEAIISIGAGLTNGGGPRERSPPLRPHDRRRWRHRNRRDRRRPRPAPRRRRGD